LISLGVVEPIPVGHSATDYLEQNVNKTLLKALTALSKEKPEDPVVKTFPLIRKSLFTILFSVMVSR
jgi:hypothetical protein